MAKGKKTKTATEKVTAQSKDSKLKLRALTAAEQQKAITLGINLANALPKTSLNSVLMKQERKEFNQLFQREETVYTRDGIQIKKSIIFGPEDL